MKEPRHLSVEELEHEAGTALQVFIKDRLAEGTVAYTTAFKEAKLLVSELFKLNA